MARTNKDYKKQHSFKNISTHLYYAHKVQIYKKGYRSAMKQWLKNMDRLIPNKQIFKQFCQNNNDYMHD